MIGPSIEPSEVGVTGLLWLFISYGYVLYFASNMISEGSELLLLVPEIAGLVGGVVLPLLGAVPDGAIILFSGLGDMETAQETLSVGVGALAGSTIMLLTIPFSLSIYSGRVDYGASGIPNYKGVPKLNPMKSWRSQLKTTGVTVTQAVQHSGFIMMITIIPYILIQIPASYLHGPTEEVAKGEHWWSLVGLLLCLAGLFWYMHLQLKISREGQDKGKRMAVMKKLLKKGMVSLSGAVAAKINEAEKKSLAVSSSEYQSMGTADGGGDNYIPPVIIEDLKEICHDAFHSYDEDGNGQLDRREVAVFFRDFHEAITEDELEMLFQKIDTDHSGSISFDEFIVLTYHLIKAKEAGDIEGGSVRSKNAARMIADSALSDENEEEEEEVPEEFTDLPPDQQQKAIKKQAAIMLTIGTGLVILFSDPMVDVMQEIAVRIGLSPFYVSFILAPLASNASEVIASMYYASKKTRKTITVALSTLCGAAALNNTFCLSIFFLLIYFRGLAWQFTAETVSIVVVELIMGFLVQKRCLSLFSGCCILTIFPLSLVLVAGLEALGFD